MIFDNDGDDIIITIIISITALALSHQYAAFNSFSNSELCSTLKLT